MWGQNNRGRSMALANWDTVCSNKKHGGLGLRDSLVWNLASLGKQVWSVALKEECLWICWVDGAYLKGSTIWNYLAPSSNNWHWKKILKVRDLLVHAVQHNAWSPSSDGRYIVKFGYYWLHSVASPFPMAAVVWNIFSIPKHNFILRLIARMRLLTSDRLHHWNLICVDTKCWHCEFGTVSLAHLYCQCQFSRDLLLRVYEWLHIQNIPLQFSSWLRWLIHCRNRKSVRH